MEYQTIQTQEREDKIGIITLHRPDKRNALSIGKMILEAPIETLKYVKGYLAGNLGKNFEESFCLEHDKPFQEMISNG